MKKSSRIRVGYIYIYIYTVFCLNQRSFDLHKAHCGCNNFWHWGDNLFLPNLLEAAGVGKLRIFGSGENRVGYLHCTEQHDVPVIHVNLPYWLALLCQSRCILFHSFKLNQSSQRFARHFERIHTHPSVLLNSARYTHVDNYCHGLIIAEKQLYEKSPHLGRSHDPPQTCRGPAIHWNKPRPFNYSIPVAREILCLHRWCNTSTSRGDDGGIDGLMVTWFPHFQATCVRVPRCASNVMMCQTPFVASRWVILLGYNCQ